MKPAMSELTKSDRGDESGTMKLSELLFGCHARGIYHNFFLPIFEILCVEQYIVVSFSQLLNHVILFNKVFLKVHSCLILVSKSLNAFCSDVHWIYAFCFAATVRHKCCFLFLFNYL